MRIALLVVFVPLWLGAQDRFVQFSSGPFEVYSDAGAKPGREVLVRVEQFRNVLGQLTGDADLGASQMVRIFVRKKDAGAFPPGLIEARDRVALVMGAGAKIPELTWTDLTRRFLDWNTGRMPAEIEDGIVTFLSTLDVSGIRPMVGRPPEAAKRNKDWALIHLLATSQEYYGKLRVIVFNLRRGADPDPAFRNAVAKSYKELQAEAARYLAAGKFETIAYSARPMSEADFPPRSIDAADARLALADLLTGAPPYRALLRDNLHVAEAHEGLGLLALRAKDKPAALKEFGAAIAAKSKSPRAYLEYARLETDNAKALAALDDALKIEPKLAAAHALIAERNSDPLQQAMHLKQATVLEPRNLGYWQRLAELHLREHEYGAAGKAWRGAEQAAAAPEDRTRMHAARMLVEQQRLDYEAAERAKAEAARIAELNRLKTEARAELRALETKANAGKAPATSDKAVAWWEGPQPDARVEGSLKQIDCLSGSARLTVQPESGAAVKLLVADPGKIAISGGGELTLACGPQRARRVKIEYLKKANPKMATTGDVVSIEFR